MSQEQGQQAPPYDRDDQAVVEPEPHSGWQIGSLRGTPVYLGRSWPLLALFILLTWGPDLQPTLGGTAYAVAFAYVLLLLVSVLAHEAAHALAAQAFGHRVHRIVVDLMGGHTSYQTLTNTPGRSAAIALSGPLTNAALALVGWFAQPYVAPGIPLYLLYAFTWANGLLAVFNLLPGLPLDGGFVLDALVWRLTGSRTWGLLVAGWAGRLLVLAGVLWLLVLPIAEGASPDLVAIMWLALLGSFLWVGATQAIRTATVRRLVDRVRVRDLAHPVAVLPAQATAADAVRAFTAGQAQALAAADDSGAPVAIVDPRVLRTVPADQLARTPVGAVAVTQPAGWVMDLAPDAPVTDALQRMAQLECGLVLGRLPDGTTVLLDAGEIEAAVQDRSVGGAH